MVTSTNYFYQVYRTGVFQGDLTPSVVEPVDPGDEMYLVFEDNVTSAELTNGNVGVITPLIDITPEDFRKNGTLLYTNPKSGDGIEQANEIPPFATDIATYKNYTFYANTKTVQRFNLAFLSVSSIVNNSSTVSIYDGTTTNTYTFQGSVESYTADFTGMIHSDFVNLITGPAKYFTLDAANDSTGYLIYYQESSTLDLLPTLSGRIPIKVTVALADTPAVIIQNTMDAILAATDDFNISLASPVMTITCSNNGFITNAQTTTLTGGFTISKDGLGTGEDAASNKIFLPRIPVGTENGLTPSQQLEQIARSMISVINKQDTIVYAYYNSSYNDVPGQIRFEQQDVTGPQFFFTSSVGNQFSPTLPSSGTTIGSTNEISPNRVYYSKLQQPEAVPLVNYIDIGPRDREIKRIIALRDSLFVFKENGIYRISGESAPFVVQEFDFSAQVLAPDSATVLNNQIYALSTQGVITVSDTGVSVISRPIENLILKIVRNEYAYKTLSFGIGYETDRAYLLFLPTETTDIVATQCLRFNIFTNTWTRWDVSATCGIVNFADETLYIGAGDINYVEKERKTLSRLDQADRQYDLTVNANGVVGNTVRVNSVSYVAINDVVVQEQYLTGSQFNRLLLKLDDDVGVTDNNYESTLAFQAGENIRSKLISLANKLDLDAGIAYTNFSNDIDSYTYSIGTVSVGSTTTTLTVGAHNILVSRYISTNLNSNLYKVVSIGANTVEVDGIIVGVPTTLQTASNNFKDIQSCYNIITDILNLDASVFFTNYPSSEGIIKFESPIIDLDKVNNKLTLKTSMMLMSGDIILYKAIPSKIIWNPIFFQDPSLLKQVREGTMMFENSNFSSVDISYATDLSPSFQGITFNGDGLGVGDWGLFAFGTINWGGIAAPVPLRTLIPLEKQRCRYMNVKFEHSVAFEKYAIYGLSLTFRAVSARGYR